MLRCIRIIRYIGIIGKSFFTRSVRWVFLIVTVFGSMGWNCKICKCLCTTKGTLLKHYRLHHATFGRGQSQPCLYEGCPCSFKTQSALRTHLSRYHAAEDCPQTAFFNCLVCKACSSTEKDYYQHLGNHLKSHETVFCVFKGCNFRTNIYNTFLKHTSRRHNSCSLSDFKVEVHRSHQNQSVELSDLPEASDTL